MTTPLLTTKLNIPPVRPRERVVPRPHLIERLNAGLHRKLTLISAPAGFGKTALISHWVQQVNRPVAWLSLDENDNNAPRFWTYVVAALRTIDLKIEGPSFSQLEPKQAFQPDVLLIPMLNQLATAPQPCMLVLDDYHVIQQHEIHNGITFALDHLPPPLHLVLISRADPPLPLSRLRVRRQLTEIRAADLRFNTVETTRFFQHHPSLGLSTEQVTALEQRTEGWIAGLQLVAHSLRRQDGESLESFIDDFTGSHRYVLDYLADEVFHHQSASLQQFLLQTAILEQFNSDVCDAVTERTDSRAVLNYLDQNNLFLIPLDEQRRWFRYHGLFADFLREQAAQTLGPAEIQDLHRHASRWHSAHERVDAAIHHAVAACDWDAAVRLLDTSTDLAQLTLQSHTFQRWFAAIPTHRLRPEPMLCIGYAWTLLINGQRRAGEQVVQWAESAVQGKVDDARLGTLYVYLALLKRLLDDMPAAMRLAKTALAHLTPERVTEHHLATAVLGMSYQQLGKARLVEETVSPILATVGHATNPFSEVMVTMVLAAAQFAQGKLHQAWHTSAQLAQAFEGRPQKLWAGLHLLQARLYYESNDLAQASDSLRTALELLERVPGQPLVTRAYYAQLAQLQWAQGDVAAARVTLDEAERSMHRLADDVHFTGVSAQRARLDLKQGDLTAAVAWLRALPAHREEPLDYRRQDEYLTRARVLIAQGSTSSLDEADQWLHRLITQAETDGRNRDLIEMLALKAILETRTDRPEQALVTLEHALALAEPQGYIRTFVDEGEPIATLLKRIKPQSRTARNYVQTILAAFPQSEIVTPSLAEPLSEREIEVLRLIADGLSAKQIADDLIISVHTARTHIRNIYGKLDVHSRVQAAERARDLNLI